MGQGQRDKKRVRGKDSKLKGTRLRKKCKIFKDLKVKVYSRAYCKCITQKAFSIFVFLILICMCFFICFSFMMDIMPFSVDTRLAALGSSLLITLLLHSKTPFLEDYKQPPPCTWSKTTKVLSSLSPSSSSISISLFLPWGYLLEKRNQLLVDILKLYVWLPFMREERSEATSSQ